MLALPALVLTVAAMPARLRGQPSQELTTVEAIRTLAPEQAAQSRPVRLRGVVTSLSGWKNWFFLQDATAGISVERKTDSPLVQPGQLVEVRGVTAPGQFAPNVTADAVTVLGKGNMPPARLFQLSQLVGGAQDSQWLAMRGIVRSAAVESIWDRPVLLLEIDMGDENLVSARVLNFTGSDWGRLPSSTVTIHGVCGTVFNNRRQFVGLRMYVPSLDDLKVERQARADPFDLPLRPLGSLLQFGEQAGAAQPVKVRGVVTYDHPGQSLYIQDENEGILVESGQAAPVALGSELEVVGYPASGRYSPTLEDAVLRVAGPVQSVRALPRAASAMIVDTQHGYSAAPYDGVLVQLQGQLLEEIPGANQDLLLLRDGATVFTAWLPQGGHKRRVLGRGSRLSVTGVCVVKVDEAHAARSFELLLRSADDLVVIEKAPWWTPAHASWVVVVLVLAILVMFGWITIARRQDHLRALSVTDHLTGLYNRRGFFLLAEHQWQVALRNNSSILLFFIDLDHFKQINDSLGHKVGDQALRDLADVLRECFRGTDIVARMGGDEFAITTGEASPEFRAAIEQRLARIVEQRNSLPGRAYKLSLSVGVLSCDSALGDLSLDDLLARADALMYRQKRQHKNRRT